MLLFFCLVLTFETHIEVYIFKNTVLVLESSLQDCPDYICHHSLASVPMQVSAAITSPPERPAYSRFKSIGDEPGRGHHGRSLLHPGPQEAGSQGRGCEPGSTNLGTHGNSTGFPLCRVCSKLLRAPKSGC